MLLVFKRNLSAMDCNCSFTTSGCRLEALKFAEAYVAMNPKTFIEGSKTSIPVKTVLQEICKSCKYFLQDLQDLALNLAHSYLASLALKMKLFLQESCKKNLQDKFLAKF